ncbi:transcriptional regulator [Yersinia sp. 2540 StPb PI]|uniref:transcriptional regulator n=1 Tax=Yersinia sp. 2540 StPb PI TaxID=3117406 RepID=UPI003FA4279A
MNKKAELVINGVPMMSSEEIATLTGKNKSDVHVDIWNILKQLYDIDKDDGKNHHIKNQRVVIVNGVIISVDGRGYISEFLLDRRHTEILISGYDVKRRAAIIDRWHALETSEAQPRLESPQPQQTFASMNDNILSLARVVAEATASATMKAVIDIVGIQKYQPVAEPVTAITPPAPETLQINNQAAASEESEYALVSELSWVSGLSDSTCRRLVTFANLLTRLTNGARGHLQINRESFMKAAQTLLDESTPPTGKLKRWQHPAFGGFTLRLKSESHTGEAE